MILHSCLGLLSFFFRFYGFGSREIHGNDGMCRTSLLTLPTQTAFVGVNVREIVLDSDGTEGALLLALTASDTRHLTGFHRYSTLVLVDTGHIYSPTLRTFLTEFDDTSRTNHRTGTAGRTFLLVDLGNARLGIDMDSPELTYRHTVATT